MTGTWLVSYVVLWLTVLVLAAAVVALLRQVGLLHARLQPLGAHFAGEGPETGSVAPPVPGVDYSAAPLTLLAFTSATCRVCEALRPSLAALRRGYPEVAIETLDLGDPARPVFESFGVWSTPYFVAVDAEGTVRARGVANSLEQIEELLEEAARPPVPA